MLHLKTGVYAGASVTGTQDSKDSSLPFVPVLLEYICFLNDANW